MHIGTLPCLVLNKAKWLGINYGAGSHILYVVLVDLDKFFIERQMMQADFHGRKFGFWNLENNKWLF